MTSQSSSTCDVSICSTHLFGVWETDTSRKIWDNDTRQGHTSCTTTAHAQSCGGGGEETPQPRRYRPVLLCCISVLKIDTLNCCLNSIQAATSTSGLCMYWFCLAAPVQMGMSNDTVHLLYGIPACMQSRSLSWPKSGSPCCRKSSTIVARQSTAVSSLRAQWKMSRCCLLFRSDNTLAQIVWLVRFKIDSALLLVA